MIGTLLNFVGAGKRRKAKARAVAILRKVIERIRQRIKEELERKLIERMKTEIPEAEEEKIKEAVREEIKRREKEIEKAAEEVAKKKRGIEVVTREVEEKIRESLKEKIAGKLELGEKEKQKIKVEKIKRTLEERLVNVISQIIMEEARRREIELSPEIVRAFVSQKVREMLDIEEPKIVSMLPELTSEKIEGLVSEVVERLTGNIDEVIETARRFKVGTPVQGVPVESRYMVPFGFIAPLFKDMSGPQIIRKVQELYHVPFDVGEKEKRKVRETYPLIPENPKPGEKVFAWAYIHWDPRSYELVYEVIEPKLTKDELEMLGKIEKKLEEKLDVIYVGKGDIEHHKQYLRNKIKEIVGLYGWKLPPQTAEKLEYYIFRDFIGLGKIEPLMHDPNIEDISCDGVGIPVYVFHRNPEYGQMKTNIVFESADELDSFVIKLAQKCGKMITVAQPLLDATLPDGSRLQATLGGDIARRGSNFTIRKFTREPLTPVHLLEYGTASSTLLAYLWICIEYGKSILIAGATATGKTTLLNAVSLFIRPELKVVSIEDTAELTLPHPNWVPHVARPGYGERGYGAVEMFDLLKAALRQRPDYVIVGEVRGKEASVMFQGMATGHPALATIHASDIQAVVDRLTTPPISLSPALLENLDILIFLEKTKLKGKFVRRVREVDEIEAVIVKENRVVPNKIFEWNPVTDEIKMVGRSKILETIARFKGIDYETVMKELERRALLLEWLKKKKIRDYRHFSQWIRAYYTDPEKIMSMVMRDVRRELEKRPA